MPVRHEFATDAAFEEALRNWFAGQALPAVIAATSAGQHHPKHLADNPIEVAMAIDAYNIADALLAHREKGQ